MSGWHEPKQYVHLDRTTRFLRHCRCVYAPHKAISSGVGHCTPGDDVGRNVGRDVVGERDGFVDGREEGDCVGIWLGENVVRRGVGGRFGTATGGDVGLRVGGVGLLELHDPLS